MKNTIKYLIAVIIFCAQIILCVLKYAEVINWPWIWVVSPFWIPLALSFVAIIGYFAFVGFTFLKGITKMR